MDKIKGVYNLSSNKKTSLHEIARLTHIITKFPILYRKVNTDSFTLDNSKLINKLKFKDKVKIINIEAIKKLL